MLREGDPPWHWLQMVLVMVAGSGLLVWWTVVPPTRWQVTHASVPVPGVPAPVGWYTDEGAMPAVWHAVQSMADWLPP